MELEEETNAEVERAAAWVLWQVRGVRHRHLQGLESGAGVAALWGMSEERRLNALGRAGLGRKSARDVCRAVEGHADPRSAFSRELQQLPSGARILHQRDDDYPRRLFDLDDPPVFLYVRGSADVLAREKTLAVVGSRDVSVDDANLAYHIVERLADCGITIVSGGALGVDAVAHRAALDAGRQTSVILPGGIDEPRPASNHAIFEEAAEQGALVTEYPAGVSVRRYHFPRRNRLIAALADATFVVRAGPDSGTLLTAEAARDIGRPLCALAGGLDEPLAEGCLSLIVSGADAVRGAEDILEAYFGGVPDEGSGAAPADGAESGDRTLEAPAHVSEDASTLVDNLRDADVDPGGAVRFSEMETMTGWPAGRLQTALLELELHGMCDKTPGANAYRFR